MISNTRPILIGIVAGEESGDILGVGLIRALKRRLEKIYFFGIGGDRMRSENMTCWYDISELSVMGFTEVILKLPNFLNIKKKLIHHFLNLKIDVFIGIDFPDFNIVLEKYLRKKGIYIIHYVSPTIWAWRGNRIFALKKAVDNILVLFPFEKPIYDYFNIPCQFIGHTLADKIPLYPNKCLMRRKLGIPIHKNCLALLPGSRMQEIKMLGKIFVMCAKLLNNKVSNLEIVVPLSDQKLIDQFIKLTSTISIKLRILYTKKAWEVLIASDVALLASGTVTLECMLAKCPMVVAYRMRPLTFFLIKYLIQIPWISFPNLLSGSNLVQEFIQKDCTTANLTQTLKDLFNFNDETRIRLQKKFYELHRSIKLNADDRAAEAVLNSIKF